MRRVPLLDRLWPAAEPGDAKLAKIISGTDGDDTLTGSKNADTVYGLGGQDRLDGADGDDLLEGGEGDDLLVGGGGNDRLLGGAGIDTASYALAFGSVTVSLATSAAQEVGIGLGFDTLSEIENLAGSPYADTLRANALANLIDGGSGNDLLIMGDGGADVALGGAGDDIIDFANAFDAADRVDGGEGIDTLILAGANRFRLDGSAIANVETIRLGPGFDYRLTIAPSLVGGGSVTIDGSLLSPADSLSVKAKIASPNGKVSIIGSAGADVLELAGQGVFDLSAGGDDTVILTRRTNTTVIFGGAYTREDQVIGFPHKAVFNGAYAEEILLGRNIANLAQAALKTGDDYVLRIGSGFGDQTLTVGWVKELDGDIGAPTLSTLTFDGSSGAGRYQVYASNGDDVLIGGYGADYFSTGEGDNILEGGLGQDRFGAYGNGLNTYVFTDALESSGPEYDVIEGITLSRTLFDLPFVVEAIDPKVRGPIAEGTLFDQALSLLLPAAALGAHHAVIVDTLLGGYNFYEFLVVDFNGVPGYQSGQDLVIGMNIEGAVVRLDNFI